MSPHIMTREELFEQMRQQAIDPDWKHFSPPCEEGEPFPAFASPSSPPVPYPSLVHTRLMLAQARTCLYRDPCGCTKATCHAGRGPGLNPREVYLSDCLACQGAMRQDSPPVR